jgi:hypothetical protein
MRNFCNLRILLIIVSYFWLNNSASIQKPYSLQHLLKLWLEFHMLQGTEGGGGVNLVVALIAFRNVWCTVSLLRPNI